MSASGLTREWFRDWFGEEYLALYPHRDQREARDAVELYLRATPPLPDAGVLDVACGAGRHLRELAGSGLQSTGLDLSPTLLRRARELAPRLPLVRGDMRSLPFADRAFGGLTSFFTSFGYFDAPEDDEIVLREMSRVLLPGGSFMLDFLNADRVRRELVEEDVRITETGRVVQRRSIVDHAVVKSIAIEPHDEGEVERFMERVRLYSSTQLEHLLSQAGLVTTHRFGDYEGAPADDQAPRLILAGRRFRNSGT